MIHSFNNLVEMKNKVILKMSKYDLTVTYFLGVSIRRTFRTTINRNRIIDTAKTKRKTENSDISEHLGKYTTKVIIGIHYIHPQN